MTKGWKDLDFWNKLERQ